MVRKHLTRGLCISAGLLLAGALTLFAEDGLSPITADDGRKIFINDSDIPHAAPHDHTGRSDGSGSHIRYIYWSNSERRWKPVPSMSATGLRARSAAAEVLAETGSSQETNAANSDGMGFISSEKVEQAIEAAAARHNVDPDLVRAVIKVESNFNPHAISRKGAMGLMQLMPGTARSLNVANPFDPAQNVDAGVKHLRSLLDDFGGDVSMSLAAYNAGAGAVQRHNGIPPYRETQAYVRQITQIYKGGLFAGNPMKAPIHVSHDSLGHLSFSNTD